MDGYTVIRMVGWLDGWMDGWNDVSYDKKKHDRKQGQKSVFGLWKFGTTHFASQSYWHLLYRKASKNRWFCLYKP